MFILQYIFTNFHMFIDTNIPFPSDSTPSTLHSFHHTLSTLSSLSYSTLIINYSLSSLPLQPPTLPSTPLPLSLLSRITLTPTPLSLPLSYSIDILSVTPTTFNTLHSACTTLPIDLISIDFSTPLPFILSHTTLHAALSRDIYFEISYGIHITTRNRCWWSGVRELVRITRGKNIVVGVGMCDGSVVRGVEEVVAILVGIGMQRESAQKCLRENAQRLIRRGKGRRGWRGVVGLDDV